MPNQFSSLTSKFATLERMRSLRKDKKVRGICPFTHSNPYSDKKARIQNGVTTLSRNHVFPSYRVQLVSRQQN